MKTNILLPVINLYPCFSVNTDIFFQSNEQGGHPTSRSRANNNNNNNNNLIESGIENQIYRVLQG